MKTLAHLAMASLCLVAPVHAGAGALSPVQYYERLSTADALYARESFADALPIYRELAAHDSLSGRLAFKINGCLMALDRPDEALASAMDMLRLGYGDRPETCVEIARVHARRGEVDEAFRWLERALADGFEQRPSIREDSVFVALHDDPRFRDVAGLPPSRELTREEGWLLDLEFFASEVARLHGDPGHFGRSAEFRAMVDDVASRVASLGDTDVAFEIQRLCARLGDGHTVMYPIPTERMMFSQLPIQLYLFSDGLFVVGGRTDAAAALIGREVTAIGSQDVATLIEDLTPLIHRDNDMAIRWLAPIFMTFPEALRAIGAVDDVGEVPMTLVDHGGQVEHVVLHGGPGGRPPKLGPPAGASGEVPLYLRDVDDNYWMEPLPELEAIYVQFNQVRDKPDESMEQFAAHLREAIDASRPRNLILDLRLNNGGRAPGWSNPPGDSVTWPLLRPLVYFEMLSDDNRLYVVTGRGTFSAAQNFLNDLERVTNAVIVGEPSSSSPNSVGVDTSTLLPWSGLHLGIASRLWQDSFETDLRPWIAVEVPVELASGEYFANRDPVMEVLGEVIGGGVGR